MKVPEPARHQQLEREKSEPHEARNPVPAMYLLVVGVVSSFGFTYLIQNGGSDLANAGDIRSAERAGPVVEASGDVLYATRCSSCHQTDGAGVANSFPRLAGSSWLLRDKETPIRIVLLGVQGTIVVEGATYTGTMPRFGHQMSDAQIARVLTHVRTSWGNHADPIEVEDVARVRATLGARSRPWQGGAELERARDILP